MIYLRDNDRYWDRVTGLLVTMSQLNCVISVMILAGWQLSVSVLPPAQLLMTLSHRQPPTAWCRWITESWPLIKPTMLFLQLKFKTRKTWAGFARSHSKLLTFCGRGFSEQFLFRIYLRARLSSIFKSSSGGLFTNCQLHIYNFPSSSILLLTSYRWRLVDIIFVWKSVWDRGVEFRFNSETTIKEFHG